MAGSFTRRKIMYLQKSDQKSEHKTKIKWLLRDSQQSTLTDSQWVMSGTKLIPLMQAAVQADIPAIEIGGGRFWEIAQLAGQNPFRLIYKIREVIEELDKREQPMELSVLMRGSNGMGFDHVDTSVQEALVRQHAAAGIKIFRIFDALNDIENINCFKVEGVHMQGALAYTMDGALESEADRIYTTEYYVNYAQKLVEKGFQSLCIKDMAGQLSAENAVDLIRQLRKKIPDHPITLHIHSTIHDQSLNTIEAAIEEGIDGIELALPPLHSGAAHHDMSLFCDHPKVKKLQKEGLDLLKENLYELFGAFQRIDVQIDADIRERFGRAGVPGGAIPSVVAMLEAQFKKDFDEAESAEQFKFLDKYLQFVARVRKDAGNPSLVTPSADIVCRQAVFSFRASPDANSPDELTIAQMYTNMTPDFAKLVLGHFGFVHCYGDSENSNRISRPKAELIELACTKQFDQKMINLWGETDVQNTHTTTRPKKKFIDYLLEVEAFIYRLGDSIAKNTGRNMAQYIAENIVFRFAEKEQVALFLAMPPKGKSTDFIWWELVLGDFKRASDKGMVDYLSVEECCELLETMFGNQCLPYAWQSKSSDLYSLSSAMPTITSKFYKHIKLIDEQLEQARAEYAAMEKQNWMTRTPIHKAKMYRLQAERDSVVRQIEFCHSIHGDKTLAENPQAQMLLDSLIYPVVWSQISDA